MSDRDAQEDQDAPRSRPTQTSTRREFLTTTALGTAALVVGCGDAAPVQSVADGAAGVRIDARAGDSGAGTIGDVSADHGGPATDLGSGGQGDKGDTGPIADVGGGADIVGDAAPSADGGADVAMPADAGADSVSGSDLGTDASVSSDLGASSDATLDDTAMTDAGGTVDVGPSSDSGASDADASPSGDADAGGAIADAETQTDSGGPDTPTPTCPETDDNVLGPAYLAGAPVRAGGELNVLNWPGIPVTITGQVLGLGCGSVADAELDLWQADEEGCYNGSPIGCVPLDPAWPLRGIVKADSDGRYSFSTVFPGLYPGRTRHIHVIVRAPGYQPVTTQLYFDGVPENATDAFIEPSLIVNLEDQADGSQAGEYDFALVSL